MVARRQLKKLVSKTFAKIFTVNISINGYFNFFQVAIATKVDQSKDL